MRMGSLISMENKKENDVENRVRFILGAAFGFIAGYAFAYGLMGCA